MKASELRQLTEQELHEKLRELRESLFNLKIQHSAGQLQNTAQLKKTKKDIARVLTVLREKQRESEQARG
ncbi:MAG TPA: 50S ribosomal protein L29 [Thermodesulforhabdus norvegica]|uniref:Large ribosomal subunit protein uL29 n=1 Tax=Thermodesulforhabdus norvegica TaxID=39841 RepID=A0A7C1AY71_9BACT|nr:50S ribosomal protein L29 [Thermodesulforhabdus norvegica]